MAMKGKDAHLRRLKNLSGASIVKAAGRVVFVGADMVRAEAFRGVSAGSVSGKNHVPSAPGEYPNRDTGVLQANFETEKTGPVSAEFRSKAPYAAALELGTSKMAARPHVRPARDKMKPKIEALFAREIDKLVKASG
ncbi:MAG: HK97-gp10 family putative phage morphogenesis protein [Pseudomonadota bacterium]